MPLVLARVDDRLIHGQVVEGWLRVIQANRIVVAADAAAGDAFQIRMMRMAVPSAVRVDVLKVAVAARAFPLGEWPGGERVMLLFPDIASARRFVESGATLRSLNLGGLHDAPDRVHITPSLALSAKDWEDVRFLEEKGVAMETRALPGDDQRAIADYREGSKAP